MLHLNDSLFVLSHAFSIKSEQILHIIELERSTTFKKITMNIFSWFNLSAKVYNTCYEKALIVYIFSICSTSWKHVQKFNLSAKIKQCGTNERRN